MADADTLALALYQALQRDDASAARSLGDQALAAALGRPRLEARLHAWLAQAATMQGDASAARKCLRAALVAARSTGLQAEIDGLKPLQAQVLAAVSAAGPPLAPPDTPVGRACAAIDAGDHEEGIKLAKLALEMAPDTRGKVFALLALARIPDQAEAAIRQAAAIADRDGDPNLVTAVAHASRASDVAFSPKVF